MSVSTKIVGQIIHVPPQYHSKPDNFILHIWYSKRMLFNVDWYCLFIENFIFWNVNGKLIKLNCCQSYNNFAPAPVFAVIKLLFVRWMGHRWPGVQVEGCWSCSNSSWSPFAKVYIRTIQECLLQCYYKHRYYH